MKPKGLEVLSLDKDYHIRFLPVSLISRHKVQNIAEILYDGGKVRTSLNHSLIIFDDQGNLISKEVSGLSKEDFLISFIENSHETKVQSIFGSGIQENNIGERFWANNPNICLPAASYNAPFPSFLTSSFTDGLMNYPGETMRSPHFIFASLCENEIFDDYQSNSITGRSKHAGLASNEAYADRTWYSQITSLTSFYPTEEGSRRRKTFYQSFLKKEYLPLKLLTSLLNGSPGKIKFDHDPRLKHAFESNGPKKVSKFFITQILGEIRPDAKKNKTLRLMKLLSSRLSVVTINRITIQKYDGYVYDVSVPGAEVFWGGISPILLHNSDDRGINVIRTTVKNFARTLPVQRHIPFRTIILDEADNLTADAQQALRRTMESYVRDCRFILLCNYSSKIIEPIQSRCAIFRFRPLDNEYIKKFLQLISAKEKISVNNAAYDAILYIAQGDMRRAINILQAAAATGKKVTEESIYLFAGRAQPEEVRSLLEIGLSGDFLRARERLHQILVAYGLSGTDVIRQVHREIYSMQIPERMKIRLADAIGEIDYRLTEGADVEIQLSAFLSKLTLIGKSLKGEMSD
ncbi:MAG: replication factor C small subunit [Candidatus Ranarchaeia archaeon]